MKENILLKKLESQTFNISARGKTTIVALLTEGWEETRELVFEINGEEAELNFICLILGKNKEKFPFKTTAIHNAPHSSSHYYIDSALFDQSEIHYQGLLKINKGAQQTNTSLSHNSLMMSEQAKTHSIPSLEIEADDVSAGHSATIGRVDEELLFYLQTRGIDREAAKLILIKGFLEANLNKIDDYGLRSILNEEINNLMKKIA